MTKGRASIIPIMLWIVIAGTISLASSSWGGSSVSVESKRDWLYAITHLHPSIYLILFFIFVLSMINLGFQSNLLHHLQTIVNKIRFRGDAPRVNADPIGIVGPIGQKRSSRSFGQSLRGPESYRMSKVPLPDGIVSVRRAPQNPDHEPVEAIPTPLDGQDHPIPEFKVRDSSKSKTSKSSDSEKEKTLPSKEFKFSSAVDVPSPEEIERREREKIVVSGRVVDPSSNGLTTAVVYLSDEDGNKVGQSCRTNSDTGSFRVQANESGIYSINVYRRGYVMDSDGPIVLPVKSGKLEDFDIVMLPEGCLIQGKVISEIDHGPTSGLIVKCACRSEQFKFDTTTDMDGSFQVFGAPLNSECVLDVFTPDGEVLLSSKPFETVQKKHLLVDFEVDYPGDYHDNLLAEELGTLDVDVDVDVDESKEEKAIHSNAV
ncbi:MAG: carboxypeptidase-like regulatory domain-containing protein [Syntrophaceae bacterium]|nr:carboxypeptidase-like regulatory domain-containing protein [Syntrophaceae bacterium]